MVFNRCIVFSTFLLTVRECYGFHASALVGRRIRPKPSPSSELCAVKEEGRRDFLFLLSTFAVGGNPGRAFGIVTDETSSFANTNADSAYSPKNLGTSSSNTAPNSNTSVPATTLTPSVQSETKLATDEVEINIPLSKIMSSPLGIEVADVEFRTNRRVYVKTVSPSSLAAQLGIQKNWVIVSVNGQSTERTDARGVKQIISQAMQSNSTNSLKLVFRDNSFQDQLQSLSTNKEAVTQASPLV